MDIILCVVFLSEEPKVPPLLAVPRADKPLPIILTSSSSPTLTDGNSHDNASARDPIDPPLPSANFRPKALLASSPSAPMLSSTTLIALGREPPIPTPSQSSSSSTRTLSSASGSSSSIYLGPP
ncbi:hypothetical protein V8E53_004244 [Lactarius tabidus]